MIIHKGEVVFRQGDIGPLYHLKSGLLKISRLHEDGTQTLVNIITPDEIIPHHSLIAQNPYHGTAIALTTCEIELIQTESWYRSIAQDAELCRDIALRLQDKLRMMQQRIDQLTEVTPMNRLIKLQAWFKQYVGTAALSEILTQEEIGQFIGLRRETVNRLLRDQTVSASAGSASKLPLGPKNS
ncbi:Crp/Fnr family transcriptional regulator [Paenibacillus montaniterrae]|uniref:Crp/Fnr family transcriptional regulator n=1 Tax=Paenibacillus montaniterrae TaxID=429341 RepID=A0A919YSA0_9BACL|nr:Crp/Fnr family transcriptional regulator [Paenibacillus montaniterrae]GIP19153.1 Crp/Fnr family transcriptional regulator [Paenibacillus montaniterrae]